MRRRGTRSFATLEGLQRGDELRALGETTDISRGGLSVRTTESLELGSELDIRVISERSQIDLRVRVVRQRERGYGLALIEGAEPEPLWQELIDGLSGRGARIDDRRRAPRVDTRIETSWSDGERSVKATLVDLSPRGARLECEEVPAHGAVITLFLPSESGELSCGARVAHRDASAFGVVFEQPSQAFRAAVRRLLVGFETD